MTEAIDIPNKSSFKMNEVCALTKVKSYVLRFWESEFTEIAPLVSSAGLKLYEHRDIEAILLIKKLLFDDKLSIDKAKSEMKILMPREHLVEASFNECQDDNLSKDYFYEGPRVLHEADLKKLMMAKNKLTEILQLTEVLHKHNNWK